MLLEAAALTFLALDAVYHRWFEDKPQKSRAKQEIQLPGSDAGAPVQLIYGRVRARNPILAWSSAPSFSDGYYRMNMLFTLGIGFDDNQGTNAVHAMWAGDKKLGWTSDGFNGASVTGPLLNGVVVSDGWAEYLDGAITQVVANDGDTYLTAPTQTGRTLLTPTATPGGGGLTTDDIAGFRGFITVLLYAPGGVFNFGASPAVPAYSFELSSYRSSSSYPARGSDAQIGLDSNPVNVLFDMYVAKLAKAGLDSSLIDMTSWSNAAVTCKSESLGYSLYVEDARKVDEHGQDVLRTMDGVLRWRPSTGLIELKLIRPDFDPTTIPHITKDNCDRITGLAFGGWANVINKVNVVFPNRNLDYADDTMPDESPANAVRQDGQLNETTLQFPGICEPEQAKTTAKRELYARSIPIMKFRALVDSEEFADVLQGDAVKVTLSRPPLSGLIFRVADVDRGTIEDGKIGLDLITDTSSYVQGSNTPEPTSPARDWDDHIDDIYGYFT